MTKSDELYTTLGIMAEKLITAETELEKAKTDRDFWRGEWDKLRFAKPHGTSESICQTAMTTEDTIIAQATEAAQNAQQPL